jgi:hypothetical protein
MAARPVGERNGAQSLWWKELGFDGRGWLKATDPVEPENFEKKMQTNRKPEKYEQTHSLIW